MVEATRNPQAESRDIAGVTFGDLHRIEPTVHSRGFELRRARYIAYCVRNELYGKLLPDELPGSGRFLRRDSKSSFLDYVAQSTVATREYPGVHTHVSVLSENHLVDLVSTDLPVLEVLNRDDYEFALLR